MDVYSFGMLMWEILHQTVPFDGDLKACTQYVLKSDARPKINEMNVSALEQDPDAEEEYFSEGLVEIIRLCW